MNLLNNNQNEKKMGLLSATRPQETVLDLNYKKKNTLQTRLQQKKKIIVYIQENEFFIAHSAAYALGLVSTRSIMLDKPKLVQITYDIHNKLKNKEDIDIEYITLTKEKQKLKVFVDGSSFCIENSTAYALGLSSVEYFNNPESEYYYISESDVKKFSERYSVEFHSLNLTNQIKKK